MSDVSIDGQIIDPETGEILAEPGPGQLDSMIRRYREASEQAKAWDQLKGMLGAQIKDQLDAQQLDRHEADGLKASIRPTESVKRDDILSLSAEMEITDTALQAILMESAQSFTASKFRDAAYRLGVPMEMIERRINKSAHVRVDVVRKEAPHD